MSRTVYPVVPPKVEYRLTDLGLGLSKAFCGVWLWAAANFGAIEQAAMIMLKSGTNKLNSKLQ